MQFFEFGQTVHKFGHGRSKAFDQLNFGNPAVLEGIMKQRRHERLGIEFPLSTLGRHGNGVGNVGLAAIAELSQMGLIGKTVGQAYLLEVSG